MNSRPSPTQSASLYDHCLRALEHGWMLGVHGLPLMGTGDWNDGMNEVGDEGKGESVWVGWFQATVCAASPASPSSGKTMIERKSTTNAPNSCAARSRSRRGTAAGIGGRTSTTARRSARRATTNAVSTR